MKLLEIIHLPAVKIYADGSRVIERAYATHDFLGRTFRKVRTKSRRTFTANIARHATNYLCGTPLNTDESSEVVTAWENIAYNLAGFAWTGTSCDKFTYYHDVTGFIGIHMTYSKDAGGVVSFYKLDELDGLRLSTIHDDSEDKILDAIDALLSRGYTGTEFAKTLYGFYLLREEKWPSIAPYLRAIGAA